MHEVLVNRLGGLSLPRKSVVRLTDRPDMTLDVYHGRKSTMQQQQQCYISKTMGESFCMITDFRILITDFVFHKVATLGFGNLDFMILEF